MSAIIPQPRCPIAIRPATTDDLPFIDSLQKRHGKMVGWMPTKQLEGKIAAGNVLVAWAPRPCDSRRPAAPLECMGEAPMPRVEDERVGYVIAQDRYFKRDDCGIIYQLNVLPGKQRSLIGVSLIKEVFERAAYGCRLFCCWCAQDIEANHFWEACGFLPLAFRAGSETKRRVHIFWCKRIREGDTGQGGTPWWFPAETKGGSIMEDRLVFPIPPGTHWSDAKPIVLPKHTHGHTHAGETKQLEDARGAAKRATTRKVQPALTQVTKRQPLSGLMFASPQPAAAKTEKAKREKKQKVKNDPKFVSAARELRDRYLEHVNGGELVLEAAGKYEVSRLAPVAATVAAETKLLPPFGSEPQGPRQAA